MYLCVCALVSEMCVRAFLRVYNIWNERVKITFKLIASNKFDITNKVCNKCKVIKQITSFDKKKSKYKECNSSKVKCEYCSSIISFSGLRGHIKNSHKDIDLVKGIETEYYKYYIIFSKLKAKGIDIDKLLEE